MTVFINSKLNVGNKLNFHEFSNTKVFHKCIPTAIVKTPTVKVNRGDTLSKMEKKFT